MAHPLRPPSALRPWGAGVLIAMLLAGCVATTGTAQTPTRGTATTSPTTGSATPASDATASSGGTVVPEIHF